MYTHRMATVLCAFLCVLASGFFVGPEVASAASQKAAKVEKQIDQLEKVERKASTAIAFFEKSSKRKWMLHQRYSHLPCWKVPLKGPERLCALARGVVRVNTKKLRQVQVRIARLEASLLKTGNERHWNCIHRYERHPHQGWATRTGNGYFGGLQMDIDFQTTYGPRVLGFPDAETMFRVKGTADKWSPEEQMAVAENARASGRGYYPWPNTARKCGYI